MVSRQLLVSGVAVVALAFGLSACSGSDDKPKATKTAATTVAPTTPAPTPTAPVEPQGADGVTYEIQNWDKYSTDPSVLAWKQINEALAASINKQKLVPSLTGTTSKSVLREFVTAVNNAKKNEWHVLDRGDVKVRSAVTDGKKARLTVCLWAPTTALYKKNGKVYGEGEKIWFKQLATLDSTSGAWALESFRYDGNCGGGAPT